MVEHLAFGHTTSEATVVAGVRKLLPGHHMLIAGGTVRVAEFWDVLSTMQAPDHEALEDELLALLDDRWPPRW